MIMKHLLSQTIISMSQNRVLSKVFIEENIFLFIVIIKINFKKVLEEAFNLF